VDDLGVGLSVGAVIVATLIGADLLRAGRRILSRRFARLRRTTVNIYAPASVWLPAGTIIHTPDTHLALTHQVYIDAGEEVACEAEKL